MNSGGPFAVVDVGNTHLHWALVSPEWALGAHGKLKHRRAGDLGEILRKTGEELGGVVVASVNPRPLASLRQGVEESLGMDLKILEVGRNWHPEILVDHPMEVGIDRLLNARALKDLAPSGAIVVDHGTALSIDYVAPGGRYAGGSIVPGVALATRALARGTALIPQIHYEKPRSAVGTNTADCIRAGLYFGLRGLTEALVERIRREKGETLPVHVTGGDASFLLPRGRGWIHQPFLTLRGLALAAGEVFSN